MTEADIARKPWTVLSSELLVNRPPWLQLWVQNVALPNGTTIEGYLIAEERDVAMVFALTGDRQVLLVEQYKHGIGQAERDLPAGYLDAEDRSPLAGAQRELREETGYASEHWRHLGSFVLNPNRSANLFHYFLAYGVYPQTEPEWDETEALILHLVDLADIGLMVRRGEIASMASALGILLALDALSAGQA
ncbi:MAG: NUDIX hydrolase [Anaerolineae bacterium]|jgi:8-oxo-dGTP pyrophosphatase MutT (NUDIX family)|nr:NUDIX hydrolase [Anaerolineae bacterium]MDH7473120.1 NUDIX hydrolase [Anaerolineae bacterium]